MDYFDFERHYHRVLAEYCEALEQEYIKLLKTKDHLVEEVVLNEYLEEISYQQQSGLISIREPNERDTTSYNELKNAFKKDLLRRFRGKELKFKDDHINNFVKYDIPEMKENHIKWYEENTKNKAYEWDSQYMYKATDQEIIELIAKYNSYDFFREKYITKSNEREELPVLDNGKGMSGGSTAQKVLSIMLLNEVHKIKRHQDQKPLIDYIAFLTERNERNITNFVSKYINDNGEIHLTSRKNLEDYKAVREYFQKIDNQRVIALIDERIKRFNTMNDK